MTLRDFLETYCDRDCMIDVSVAKRWADVEGVSNYVGVAEQLKDNDLLDKIVKKVDASSVGLLVILVW